VFPQYIDMGLRNFGEVEMSNGRVVRLVRGNMDDCVGELILIDE